jgi:hypothetical protein
VVVSNDVSIAISDDAVLTVLASAPKLALVGYTPGIFTLSFPTENGCNYLLLYKNTLDEAQWKPLTTILGNGAVKTVPDATASGPTRFYQIKVQ